jgi:hypothetical protein
MDVEYLGEGDRDGGFLPDFVAGGRGVLDRERVFWARFLDV